MAIALISAWLGMVFLRGFGVCHFPKGNLRAWKKMLLGTWACGEYRKREVEVREESTWEQSGRDRSPRYT